MRQRQQGYGLEDPSVQAHGTPWLGAQLEIQFQNEKLESCFLLANSQVSPPLIYQWLKICISFFSEILPFNEGHNLRGKLHIPLPQTFSTMGQK